MQKIREQAMLNPRFYLGICLATLLMSVECMKKQLTMALNNHVSIVKYNARGFQSGSVYVKELLNDCDMSSRTLVAE